VIGERAFALWIQQTTLGICRRGFRLCRAGSVREGPVGRGAGGRLWGAIGTGTGQKARAWADAGQNVFAKTLWRVGMV
jgi:hypothetical protein